MHWGGWMIRRGCGGPIIVLLVSSRLVPLLITHVHGDEPRADRIWHIVIHNVELTIGVLIN
jgi:hypothetical protein